MPPEGATHAPGVLHVEGALLLPQAGGAERSTAPGVEPAARKAQHPSGALGTDELQAAPGVLDANLQRVIEEEERRLDRPVPASRGAADPVRRRCLVPTRRPAGRRRREVQARALPGIAVLGDIGSSAEHPQPQAIGNAPLEVEAGGLPSRPVALRSIQRRQDLQRRPPAVEVAGPGVVLQRQVAGRTRPPVELADRLLDRLVPGHRRAGAGKALRAAEAASRVAAERTRPLVPQRAAAEERRLVALDAPPVPAACRRLPGVKQAQGEPLAVVERFDRRPAAVHPPVGPSRPRDQVDVGTGHRRRQFHRPDAHLIHPAGIDGDRPRFAQRAFLSVDPVVGEAGRPAVYRDVRVQGVEAGGQVQIERRDGTG